MYCICIGIKPAGSAPRSAGGSELNPAAGRGLSRAVGAQRNEEPAVTVRHYRLSARTYTLTHGGGLPADYSHQ